MSDWNAAIIEEFRANDGVVGGRFAEHTVLLLHSTGARSGAERINPLLYRNEDGRIFVFGSRGGDDRHPDWYFNVVANPEIEVEIGDERYAARAVELEGTERDEVYARQAADVAWFDTYQKGTDRIIPVIEIVRAPEL